MKDSEFKALLNLYLDHEITAADAGRLEAEVQASPSRRRLYQDYCRMQKACKMLADDFATEPTAETDRKVIAFDPTAAATGHRSKVVYLSSAFAAAAACVALVFLSRSHQQSAVPTNPAVAQSALPVPPPTQLVATTPMPSAHGIVRRQADALAFRNNPDALALNASVQNDPHFSWMQDVRLTPLPAPTPADQLQLQLTPALHTENRTYTSGNKTLSSDVPSIAIRFQK